MLAVVLMFSACSSSQLKSWESLHHCYDGIQWYSWGIPHQQLKVVPIGPAYRDGEDVTAVILFEQRTSPKGLQQGFYLLTQEWARWYPFPAIPDPSVRHDYLLRFSVDSVERKIWIRLSRSADAVPAFEVLGSWPFDLRVTELAGEDMDLATAKKSFIREVIYHLQSFKATYDRQNELYQKRLPATTVPLNDQGFVQKLLICSRVPDPEVQAAARSALSEFRPRTKVKTPISTH